MGTMSGNLSRDPWEWGMPWECSMGHAMGVEAGASSSGFVFSFACADQVRADGAAVRDDGSMKRQQAIPGAQQG